MKVKSLLRNESMWIKHFYVNQGRYCLMGALQQCYLGDVGISLRGNSEKLQKFREARGKVESAINELSRLHNVRHAVKPNIMSFNDNPRTTFKDVRKVILLANV